MNQDNASDEYYMQIALHYAKQAFEEQEVPIGALIVSDKEEIIGYGSNKVERNKTQTAHAEMEALQKAALQKNNWRLENCRLYVTLEPCLMCMGALRLSRIKHVFFGAHSHLFGNHLDRDFFIPLYNKNISVIKGGINEEECAAILKKFFQNKRKKSE